MARPVGGGVRDDLGMSAYALPLPITRVSATKPMLRLQRAGHGAQLEVGGSVSDAASVEGNSVGGNPQCRPDSHARFLKRELVAGNKQGAH